MPPSYLPDLDLRQSCNFFIERIDGGMSLVVDLRDSFRGFLLNERFY